jgi:NAD(P)-dependent dehydrogenase (short-subunit alcohol dehydrogenase family)
MYKCQRAGVKWPGSETARTAGPPGGRRKKGAFDAFVRQTTPLGREQTPEDIGEAVVYLCRAENVTGITLAVAGGVEMH